MNDDQELCEPNDENGAGHDWQEDTPGIWLCKDCPARQGWGLEVDAETVVRR